MGTTAGVLAVQGDVSEHARAIRHAGQQQGREITVREVRGSGVVPECDLLSIPGGESTAISRLVHREGIAPEIRDHVDAGRPVLATCAGLILLSDDSGDDRVETLGLLDVGVERNAFGRQRDSFEAPLDVRGFDEPFPAVFIRAPVVASVGSDVEVLAEWESQPVAVRQENILGTAFHPELSGDWRIHHRALFDRRATTDYG
jgi:5'-phosphate synthase pdxT subunit